MKRNLYLKLIGSGFLVLLLSLLVDLTRPKKDYSKIMLDWFWVNKTHYSKNNNMLFIGDSRTYRGISPADIQPFFPKHKILNLGYSSGGLNKYMLNQSLGYLEKNKNNNILVLGVTPFSLTEEARINQHFKQELERPLAAVVERKYLNPHLIFFEPIAISSYKKSMHKIVYPQIFHSNGWVESAKIPENKTEALLSYKTIFSTTSLSNKSMYEVFSFVSECTNKGLRIYGYRPPTTKDMESLEQELTGFDERIFKKTFEENGGEWIDLPNRYAFNVYDGSHLHYQSAKELSLLIAKKIKKR